MKHLQAVIIIFCLGLFLVPKDNFYALSSQENCCKNEKMPNCCKKNKQKNSNNKHSEKKTSCKDDCCNVCTICFSFIETPFSNGFKLEYSYYKAKKNQLFQYSDPHISDRFKEIWQPPKIV